MQIPSTLQTALFMASALNDAKQYLGATAPNPPVGACIVQEAKILAVASHLGAGLKHAEVRAIETAIEKHGFESLKGATLYVTLEPCNHHGKTPPCVDAILKSGIRKVVIGAKDPNPKVKGGGAQALIAAGVEVEFVQGHLKTEAEQLIAPFTKWSITGQPYILHKLAYRSQASGELTMIPEDASKQNTFTQPESSKLAHLARKHSDAILTGIETVLKDNPSFTVRHVPDHPGKKRYLIVCSKSGRIPPQSWMERQSKAGFEVLSFLDARAALSFLGEKQVHQVLIEAGPTLSHWMIEQGLWDERLVFIHNSETNQDFNFREKRCLQES